MDEAGRRRAGAWESTGSPRAWLYPAEWDRRSTMNPDELGIDELALAAGGLAQAERGESVELAVSALADLMQ
jgi:hypothetical protein